MRKVMVLTGKRGGFGAMKPMLRVLRDDPAFELQLVVTDQHLNPRFGRTIAEVEREFPIAAAVDIGQTDDSALGRAQALGRCVTLMAETLEQLRPDCCVLYGDRGEVLATALAATTLGVPIVHLQGGDVSGSVDEQMRHAMTKLAHLHCPSTEMSARRILAMGEESWRVHVVGDNHIDLIVAGEYLSPNEVGSQLDLDPGRPIVVVLQHSETTAPDSAYAQMVETLEAVRCIGCQAVVVYPCSDVGYQGVVQAIDELAVGPNFRVFRNLDAPVFWGLLAIASVLVGNSSAGIIESPTFRLPVVNVGRRQENRERAGNVLDVPHERGAILAALRQSVADPDFRAEVAMCPQIYGDGRAGERVVDLLRRTEPDSRLWVKRMTY